jgi:hypothetical protein
VEEPAQPACGPPRRDYRAATPTPLFCVPEAQRRRVQRGDRSNCSAQALPGSRRAPTNTPSRIRTAGAATCARACAPAAAVPSGRIERATRERRRCDLWRLRRSPSVRSIDPRVPLRPAPAGRPRQSIVIRRTGTRSGAATRKRRRARSRAGGRRPPQRDTVKCRSGISPGQADEPFQAHLRPTAPLPGRPDPSHIIAVVECETKDVCPPPEEGGDIFGSPDTAAPPASATCIEELSKPIPDQEIFDARKPRKLPEAACCPEADQP